MTVRLAFFAIKVREGNVPSGILSAFKHPILELSALINRSARKLMREATATADLGLCSVSIPS